MLINTFKWFQPHCTMAMAAVKNLMTVQGITKVDKSSTTGHTQNQATHSTGKLMGMAPKTNGNITAVRLVLVDNSICG